MNTQHHTSPVSLTPVAPGVWRLRLGTPEKFTPLSINPAQPLAAAMEALDSASYPWSAQQFHLRQTPRGCLVAMPATRDEAFYGLGLQLKSFNQRGLKKTLRVNSDPVADTGDSHAPVPFFVSTRGYGLLVDTARYASFYFASHALNTEAQLPGQERQTPATSTEELYQASAAGQKIVIEIPAATGVDLYLFAGPDLRQAVQRYNLFSGGGCLPPMWGLGVWYRCDARSTSAQALALARQFRQDNLPCDVWGLEPGWQTQAYSCSYLWNTQNFPDPAGYIAQMKQLGMHINLWEHVFVHPHSPLYAPLQTYSGDNLVWNGLVPDLTCKEARQHYADYHRQNMADLGVTGFKLDECDNSDFIKSPWSFPEHSCFPSGLDGEQMHSILGLLYQQTILDVFAPSQKRTYSQVRSSGVGAAPLPFVLYSDLYDHRDFIHGVVNSGFTGLLWSPEVREAKSVEDLCLRIQSVIFSHQALINAWYIPNPPWWQIDREKNNANQRMEDFAQATAQVRKLFALRMSLLPYLYSAFARYRFEGLPPIRALVMDWPDDPAVRNIADQWMFGDNLLVAPLVAPETSRGVYLPQGKWFDFWTHAPLEGGQTIQVQPPLDQIPLYVRANTILPLADPVLSVQPDTPFSLTAWVFGDHPDPFELFEDDGETQQYQQGQYNRVKLTWDGKAPQVTRQGNFSGQRYHVAHWHKL